MFRIVGNGVSYHFAAIGRGPGHGYSASAGHLEVGCLVLVSVSVTTDDNRLGPAWNQTRNVGNDDRFAEDNAVQDVTDGAVRAFPHLLQLELFDARFVWGDGGTLHTNAVLFDGVRRINGDLIVGGVAVLNRKIVVLKVYIEKWQDQIVFDVLPNNTGHFVAV